LAAFFAARLAALVALTFHSSSSAAGAGLPLCSDLKSDSDDEDVEATTGRGSRRTDEVADDEDG